MLIDIGNGVVVDAEQQLRDLDRVEYEDSLYAFLKAAWRFIDPSPWIDSWAIGAVAEHLEAVADGEIRRLMIHIPPRMGKPVRHDALISTDRGLIPLSEVIIGDRVLTHKGRFQRVAEVHRQGTLPTLRLTTRNGRWVSAAADHPFLTPGGWVELGDLAPQEVVATVPQYGRSGGETITPEVARLLGYLVGDGSCKGTPTITVADDIEAADIEGVIAAAGFTSATQTYRMANTGHMLRRIAMKAQADHVHSRGPGYRGPVRQFMEEHDLWGKSSYTKLIPGAVMRGSDEVVRAFISAYWACDGFVSTRGAKRDGCERDDLAIGCDSVNRAFMMQMQTLLLRIGISTHVRKRVARIRTAKQGDTYTSYSMTITSQDDCWRFASAITIPHTKNSRLEKARKRRFDFDRVIRGEVIEAVEPDGDAECICLTVENDHSFVANGFAVHNSSLCSVAFPAWVWAQPNDSPTAGPSVPFLSASYDLRLSLRDNVKCRRLIQSPWYQSMWGSRFQLNDDQNAKSRFSNNRKGERLITSIGAGVTGEGANIILVDDPNSASEVSSEATIQSTIDWWDGTMSSRLNDPKTGAYVVIQQRLAENDLSGHILDREAGEWTHLCLPMRFEQDRSFVTTIGWEDPRTQEGELLCPDRFGEPEVAALERTMGPWIASGQLQQRPERKGGGIIKREWWEPWEIKEYPPFDYILASADTAFTEKQENDCSALTIWGVFTTDPMATAGRLIGPDGRPVYSGPVYTEQAPKVMLMHAWHGRLELHDLVSLIAHICGAQPPSVIDQRWDELTRDAKGRRFPRFPIDKLIIEAKASGHSVAQEIRRIYGGENFGVQLIDPGSQDKVARLYSVQHLFAEGMIYAPDRTWADEVITQVATFPKSKLKDLTDTVSQALRHLRDMGLLIRAPERLQEIEASKVFTGRPPAPLYPA